MPATAPPRSDAPVLPLGIPDPSVARDLVSLTREERRALRAWTFFLPFVAAVVVFGLGSVVTAAVVMATRPPPLDPARDLVDVKALVLSEEIRAQGQGAADLVCADVDPRDDVAAAVIARADVLPRVVPMSLCRFAERTLERAASLVFVGDVHWKPGRRVIAYAGYGGRTKLTLDKRGDAFTVVDVKRH